MMSYLRSLLPNVGPAIFERMRVGMAGLVILLGVAMLLPGQPAVAAGVTLTVDKNNVFAGEQFVLTATAATESNISILGINDAGQRTNEGNCTVTYRCSLARSHNGLRVLRYIAVAQDRGTLAVSESSIVTVQRKDMAITLKADKTTVNNWERVTFTMTPNQSQVDIKLMQIGIGGQPDSSVTGQSCRVFTLPTWCQTAALNYPGGPSREYYATMQMLATGEQIRSGIVKISRNTLEIRIEADRTEAADYESINLTATPNQSGTQIALLMVGSPDAAFAWCPSSGPLICTGRTVLGGARTATLYAVMRDPNGGEVQSNRVVVRRSPVTVTLMADKQEVKPGESFKLNATRNQTGGGLQWAIYDADTGQVVPSSCVPAWTTCSVSDTLRDKPQRQFKAIVFERDGSVAGESQVVTVTKPKPKVTLALDEGSESEILPHEGVSLVATVDQLADQVTITNRRTGRALQVACIRGTPTECRASDKPFQEESGFIGPPPPTVANYIAVAKVGSLQRESKNVRVNRIELTPTLAAGRTMDRAAIEVAADVPRLPDSNRLLGYFLSVQVLQPDSDPMAPGSWKAICFRYLHDLTQEMNCRNIALTDPALVLREPPPRFRAGVFYVNALVSELVNATVGAPKKPTVILDADDLVIGGGVGILTTTLTATVTPVIEGVTVRLRVTKPDGSTRTERMTRPDDRNPSRYTATVSAGDVGIQGSAQYQVEIVLGEDVLATSNEVEIRHAPLE
jgi:hypothetical protein